MYELVCIVCLIVVGAVLCVGCFTHAQVRLEVLRQQALDRRHSNPPREWWQDVALELARNPDLVPILTENLPQLSSLISQLPKILTGVSKRGEKSITTTLKDLL